MANNEIIRFQVVADDGFWLVRQITTHFSFSYVPAKFRCDFEKKSEAIEQVARLARYQAKGGKVELKYMETPCAFEHVADKKYGCEW